MDRQQILAQLGAIRAICDALGAALAAEIDAAADQGLGACPHPEDQREDISTLREKRYFCRACKTIVAE